MAKHENISIPKSEYEISAQLSSGPGGQHVNKVASAIRLTFDIHASQSLSEDQKTRLLQYADRRIGKLGIVRILASNHRTQIRNKEEAIQRLHDLIEKGTQKKKKRLRKKMSFSAKQKIKEAKKHRSKLKSMRKKVDY